MRTKLAEATSELNGVLTIVFVVLKLCHVIDWKWVWVLSPVWISIGLAIIVCAAIVLAAVAKASMGGKR